MADDKYQDELKAALGKDQIDVDDDITISALDGIYEGVEDDELDILMDAADDMEDEILTPDADSELARGIAAECQGVEANGSPRASIAISLEMIQPDTDSRKMLAQHSSYKPVIKISNRYEFIEISLTYPVENDNEMKVVWAHLEHYGTLLNSLTETSVEAPLMSLVLVPISGMGVHYMCACNPVMWVIQPEKPGGSNNRLTLLYRCEDIMFYSAADMDMGEVAASAVRAVQQEKEAEAAMYEKEERRKAEQQEYNRRIEEIRDKNRNG